MKDMSKVLMQLWDLSAEHVTDTVRTYTLVGLIQGLDQRHLRGVLAAIIQTVQDSSDEVQFKRLTREMERFADYAIRQKENAIERKKLTDDNEKLRDRIERAERALGIGNTKPTTPLKKKESILSAEYLSFLGKEGKGAVVGENNRVIQFPPG